MTNRSLQLLGTAALAGAVAGGLVAWGMAAGGHAAGGVAAGSGVAVASAPAGGSQQGLEAGARQMRIALDEERAARRSLEEEVALLQSVVDAMLALSDGDPGDAFALADEEADVGEDAGAASGAAGRSAVRQRGQRRVGLSFDETLLAAQGVQPSEIDRVRERWEKNELDRLYLTDEARREGWLGSGKHRQRMQEINAGLREDLGEQAYDQMLYATGRPNRIVVRDVLSGSQASEVGILPGDQILRYDGARIFAPRELSRSTSTGEAGAPVRIEVLRQGRSEVLWLERGPIGVMLDHENLAPANS